MTYTLSDCIESINQILNYPSVTYGDISIYFDQAISELNTELHIGLRPISVLYNETADIYENITPLITLSKRPTGTAITSSSTASNIYCKDGTLYYLDLETNTFKEAKKVYGLYSTFDEVTHAPINEIYQTIVLGTYAYWTALEKYSERDVELTEYIPYDWIVLFLIPYVCFKYAIRNGDSGAAYAEDLSQGFQQLKKSYNVPSKVVIARYADKKAYRKDVTDNLSNLNKVVPTRAIFEDMKVDSIIPAEYDDFYSKGGWGF